MEAQFNSEKLGADGRTRSSLTYLDVFSTRHSVRVLTSANIEWYLSVSTLPISSPWPAPSDTVRWL